MKLNKKLPLLFNPVPVTLQADAVNHIRTCHLKSMWGIWGGTRRDGEGVDELGYEIRKIKKNYLQDSTLKRSSQ